MDIETEIFKKTKIDFNKILKYGFKKENSIYKYSKYIIDNNFQVIIEINEEGLVKGKIYDLAFDEEYTNFRIENAKSSFVNKVREAYIDLLNDIKKNCFVINPFIYDQANRIAKEIYKKYQDEPNFEWDKFPDFATFKNKDSNKWYAIIMNIDKSKLDSELANEIEIINIKLNPEKIEKLLKKEGFYPAYHMNKKSWLTITLDNTIPDETIMELIHESYSYTIKKSNLNNEWIIPANPTYFDIEKYLENNSSITWKQSTDIKVGDIIYLYVGAPFSSIMYKLKAQKVNIPYNYNDNNLKIKMAMQLKLLEKYDKGVLSFAILKKYGINAVRGPRYMNESLHNYINNLNKKS